MFNKGWTQTPSNNLHINPKQEASLLSPSGWKVTLDNFSARRCTTYLVPHAFLIEVTFFLSVALAQIFSVRVSRSTLYSRQGEGARRTLISLHSRISVSRTVLSHCTLALHFRTALSHCTPVSSLYSRHYTLDSLYSRLSVLYSRLCTLISASRTALSTL